LNDAYGVANGWTASDLAILGDSKLAKLVIAAKPVLYQRFERGFARWRGRIVCEGADWASAAPARTQAGEKAGLPPIAEKASNSDAKCNTPAL
jgi:hypothetical protein